MHSDRVNALLSDRNGGELTLDEFRHRIEDFSADELGQLARALLGNSLAQRDRFEQDWGQSEPEQTEALLPS